MSSYHSINHLNNSLLMYESPLYSDSIVHSYFTNKMGLMALRTAINVWTNIGGSEMGSMYLQSQEVRWYMHEGLAYL